MKNINEQLLVNETLFFVGNGYVGIRGNYEEGYPDGFDTIRGTYINGFYEIVDVTYGESAYGFPTTAQKMVNIIDAQGLDIYINNEKFSMFEGQVLNEKRFLDINKGIYTREVKWQSPKGNTIKIRFDRLTSFEVLELALVNITVESVDFEGELKIISTVNGNVENYTNSNDPRVASSHGKLLKVNKIKTRDSIAQLTCLTKRSNLEVCCSVDYSVVMETSYDAGSYSATLTRDMKIGSTILLTKFIAYTDSIRHKNLMLDGYKIIKNATKLGCEYFINIQKAYLDEFWNYSKVAITGKPQIDEALNYSVYQLLASAGRDPHSNICAKGLSGEGYEGHYFWDTEVYMLPFFILTNPKIAKNLLKFRYETLEFAKDRALEMGHVQGAKVPWRTISGTECSGYFPAGSAQYHINADVAFSYIQYYLLHDDIEFMKEIGFEVLLETGRIWMDMGCFTKDNAFMIHSVTGPDEYTAIVNNNYYTNAMAKYHLEWIVKIAKRIMSEEKSIYVAIMKRLNSDNDELERIAKAAEHMYFEFDKELGIYMQDDSFKTKPTWDFANTPKDNYPLLLHYHPLTIYRHKVLKQADTILAMILLDNVDIDIFEKSYDYYEPLTTHDSSLSPCAYSMAASRINRSDVAYSFFDKTIRLDLDNLHHNTRDGLHIANAGGAYMAVVYGFGGLRIKEDGIHLNPSMPDELSGISFNINKKENLIKVRLWERITITSETKTIIWIYENKYEIDGTLEVEYGTKD